MRWDVARGLDQAHGLPRSSVFDTLYRSDTWRDIERGRGDRQAWLEEAHRTLEERAGRPLHVCTMSGAGRRGPSKPTWLSSVTCAPRTGWGC